jgi:hypothetical protein
MTRSKSRNHCAVVSIFQPLLVACLSAFVIWAYDAVAEDSPAVSHPTYGVRFERPSGWATMMEDGQKTIGVWAYPSAARTQKVIRIETGRPTDSSAKSTAEGLARNFGGSVAKETTLLDGETAWRVQVDDKPVQQTVHPVEALVATHNGYIYLVMGGVAGDQTCAAEIERIRSSWTWLPIEAPSTHLELRAEPVAPFGGRLTMSVPATMRTLPSDDPNRLLNLAIFDLRRYDTDFQMVVQLLDRDRNRSFDDIKAAFLQELGPKLKLKDVPKWIELKETHQEKGAAPSPAIAISEVLDGAAVANGKPLKVVFALVDLSANQTVLVNFTLAAATDEERQRYVPVINQIVASVRASQSEKPPIQK